MNSQVETKKPDAKMVTPYQLLGGQDGVRRLAEAFYDAMDEMPQAAAVRAMHGSDLSGIRQKLFEYLCGWLGGPDIYVQKHGHVCMMSVHARYPIGFAERDQWMFCMRQALQRVQAQPEVCRVLDLHLSRFTEAMRNVGDATRASQNG